MSQESLTTGKSYTLYVRTVVTIGDEYRNGYLVFNSLDNKPYKDDKLALLNKADYLLSEQEVTISAPSDEVLSGIRCRMLGRK